MKIYSDTIQYQDIRNALPSSVQVELFNSFVPRKRNPETGRPFNLGYDISLSGSSCHRSQAGSYMAATWDEWGIFIDRLFTLDPQAVIGYHENYFDFVENTKRTRDFYANENSRTAREHRAPWFHAE